MAPAANLQELARNFIAALETLNLDNMIAIRSPDCTQKIHPKSMGYPLMDNAAYRRAYESMLPYFSGYKATIHSMATDTVWNKVVMHVSSTAETIAGPYINEYMFILHMAEDGTKLKMVEEYVDSFRAKEQNTKLKSAIAEAEKGSTT